MALDKRQNSVYAQYLVNYLMDFLSNFVHALINIDKF